MTVPVAENVSGMSPKSLMVSITKLCNQTVDT
jgi:hypothetical protein